MTITTKLYLDYNHIINQPETDLININYSISMLIELLTDEIDYLKNRDQINLEKLQLPKQQIVDFLNKFYQFLEHNPNYLKDHLDQAERFKWQELIKIMDEKFLQYQRQLAISTEVNNKLLEILQNSIVSQVTENVSYNKNGQLITRRKDNIS